MYYFGNILLTDSAFSGHKDSEVGGRNKNRRFNGPVEPGVISYYIVLVF